MRYTVRFLASITPSCEAKTLPSLLPSSPPQLLLGDLSVSLVCWSHCLRPARERAPSPGLVGSLLLMTLSCVTAPNSPWVPNQCGLCKAPRTPHCPAPALRHFRLDVICAGSSLGAASRQMLGPAGAEKVYSPVGTRVPPLSTMLATVASFNESRIARLSPVPCCFGIFPSRTIPETHAGTDARAMCADRWRQIVARNKVFF